jgi:hypothetical protein
MGDSNKMTLSDIRQEVVRRSKHVEDLKVRLEKLGQELQEILLDIDEVEGVSEPRKRRGRRPAQAEAEGEVDEDAPGDGDPAQADESLRRRRGRPPKAERPEAEPAAGGDLAAPPEPPARKGPSIVDVAVEILKAEGKALGPAELAQKVEERGGVSGNTQQVLLMAAGRRSRLTKTEDGAIALIPDESPKPE